MSTATVDTSAIDKLLGVTSPDKATTWMNNLFYGDPGCGKTYLLGTALDHPDLWPMVIFDCDGGSKTLSRRPGVKVVKTTDYATLTEKFNALYSLGDKLPYKSVAVDNLTEVQKVNMAFCMAKAVANNSDRDKYVPSMAEWSKSGEMIRSLVRGFRDLPCHTFFTCYADKEYEGEGTSGPFKYLPDIPGKLAWHVPGFLDVVGYMSTVVNQSGGVTRQIQFLQTKKVVAKDRTGNLPDLVRDTDLPTLWNYIQGKGELTNAAA